MKRLVAILAYTLLPLGYAAGGSFDHSHRAWTDLLRQHVVLIDGGSGFQVRYGDFKRTELKAYLDTLSSVTLPEFERWSKAQQLAFLLNAYNAFTVELILTRYPDLESLRDFGRFIDSGKSASSSCWDLLATTTPRLSDIRGARSSAANRGGSSDPAHICRGSCPK